MLSCRASAHPRTRDTVRSVRGSRTLPSRLSAYEPSGAGCAQSRHRLATSPAACLRHLIFGRVPPHFQKTTAAVRSSCRLGGRSHLHLNSLIRGAAVAVHHLEFLG